MTDKEVIGLVMRSWRKEHGREITKDELIAVLASWLSKWIKKPSDTHAWPVKPEPKQLP